MSGVCCAVLALSGTSRVLWAQTEHDFLLRKIRAGDHEAALAQLTSSLLTRYGLAPTDAHEVFTAFLWTFDRDKKKKAETCREFAKRAVDMGRLGTRSRPGAVEQRILLAEARVVEARLKRMLGDDDWLDAWRDAAKELRKWAGAERKRARAHARAVALLGEAATLKGSPAEALIQEAKVLALGETGAEAVESLPWLSYLLVRCDHLVRKGRRTEAKKALAPWFVPLRKTLDPVVPDRDAGTLYNDAAQMAQRHNLGVPLDLITEEHEGAGLTMDVPASHRWIFPEKPTDYQVGLFQRNRDGSLRREIRIFHSPNPEAKDPEEGIRKWKKRMKRLTGKAGRRRKVKNRLGLGVLLEGSAKDRWNRFVTHHYYVFHDKKGRSYTVLLMIYGKEALKDPDAALWLGSLREAP
jgi:hypothetical protein